MIPTMNLKDTRNYAFRCETPVDATFIKQLFARWIKVWIEHPLEDDVYAEFPDRLVIFAARQETFSIEKLRFILNECVDLHVAAESLREWSDYTGERTPVVEMKFNHQELEILTEIVEDAVEMFGMHSDKINELADFVRALRMIAKNEA